jgi:hypothetical protein
MSAEKDLASLEEQRCAAMIAADCPVLSELRAGRRPDRALTNNADRNRPEAKGSKRSTTGIAA